MTAENKILSLLLNGPLSYWDLLACTNILIKDFILSLNNLIDSGYICYRNEFIFLTERGKEYCKREEIGPFKNYRCKRCEGQTIDFALLPPEKVKKYLEIYSNHPSNLSEYDQGCVTPEISLARTCYFLNKGDVQNSSIIFIGDDDLTSIALALFSNFKRIVVLDIDKRFIEFINEVVRTESIKNFEAFGYDVRDPLPVDFLKSFDVFFTDPVETIPGFTLFINRGIQSLKGKDCCGYFGLTYMEASHKKWHLFEKNLIESGFIITDILEKFNFYNLPPLIEGRGYKVLDLAPFRVNSINKLWYNSSLFRIYSVIEPKIIDESFINLDAGSDFYLDEDGYVVSI